MRRRLAVIRSVLVLTLVGGVVVAGGATLVALNELVFHGFAPSCADGYAEVSGEPPCRPDWAVATPALIMLGAAAMAAAASAATLMFGREKQSREVL